jgi:hypothetical protein
MLIMVQKILFFLYTCLLILYNVLIAFRILLLMIKF